MAFSKYVRWTSDSRIVCRICDATFSASFDRKGVMTNMRRHIRRHHPGVSNDSRCENRRTISLRQAGGEVNDDFAKASYFTPSDKGALGGVERFRKSEAEKEERPVKPEEAREWLRSQDAYSLHKPARRKFRRNPVLVYGIDDQWQADLVDMQKFAARNEGFRYILTCIDILSKHAWAIPVRNKRAGEVRDAFDAILIDSGRTPRRIQTDKGTEFLNTEFQALLKRKEIRFFTTESELKAQVVERFNRTLQEAMRRLFRANNTRRYIDDLDGLVNSYNSRVHSSIGMAPRDVNAKNERQVWRALYADIVDGEPKEPRHFKVGDQVRLSRIKGLMEKGYEQNWTEEIYVVRQCIPGEPRPLYRIKDTQGEAVQGRFYPEELQLVKKDLGGTFLVERVLDERTLKGQKQLFVKWHGWPEKFNSWVVADQVQHFKGNE